MYNLQDTIPAISHPLISSVYLKTDFGTDMSQYREDVLVIEPNFNHENTDHESFDLYLTTLLGDLQDIQHQAEERLGHFDRVDIRTH